MSKKSCQHLPVASPQPVTPNPSFPGKAPSDVVFHSVAEVSSRLPLDLPSLQRVEEVYPFKASGYFLSLMNDHDDAISRQILPDPAELEDTGGVEDPLAEEHLSPVPNLVHRYPNRVLWLVSHRCAVHCRFCTRKRLWKHPVPLTDHSLVAGLQYIAAHREIQDVLLSGGDPLLLPLTLLERILTSLRLLPHVQIVRIGTRVPAVLPGTVTPRLVRMLRRHHPIYLNIHFNHPWEITSQSQKACTALADAGIPLGSQTVLLKGINDREDVLGDLFQRLLTLRVRPYYLMQMDLTRGTGHFRTPLSRGLEILKALRNHKSGLAMPQFVVDLPGGQGKIPLVPSHVEALEEDRLVFRDYRGALCPYPLLPGEGPELVRWLKP